MGRVRKRKTYRIDIRDQRLPGGRFACSARTTSAPEYRAREAAVRALIDRGEWELLSRITTPGETRLHIADVARAVAEGDLDTLRVAGDLSLTLGATADRLLRTKEATRSAGTLKQVQITIRQLEAHFGVKREKESRRVLADVDLLPIGRAECEEFLHKLRAGGKPWAPKTQEVRRAYAQQVWELAIRDEEELAEKERRRPRIERNPWKSVEAAPVVPTRVIFLTAPERDALLGKLRGTPACALMAVAYHAGLRLAEACYLRTGIDVDLNAGVLRIQNRGGAHAWKTKSPNSVREVPVNRTLQTLLQEHIDLGFAGARYFFHPPRKDKPIALRTAYTWWTEAYDAAGIKWGRSDVDTVTYHTGRHTFASLLVQQGVSVLIVAELLGDTYEQVVKTYGHLTPHNLRDAVTLLEEKLPEAA